MKIKNIITIFLVAFILASCASAVKVVQTETAIPTTTLTLVPAIPTKTPIPTRTPISFPSNVKIIVDGAVPDTTVLQNKNIAIIQKAISIVSNEVEVKGYNPGNITVYIATKKDTFLPMYMEGRKNAGFPLSENQAKKDIENGLDGEAAKGYLVLYIGGENWERSVDDRYTQIIHEFFHTIQMGISNKSGFGDENKPGPIWLIEGSASYFASSIAYKYGITSSWYGWDWNSANQMFPNIKLFDTIAIGYSNESPYVIGIAATAKLVSLFGEDKIYEYFLLNNGKNWEEAFESTFGITIEEFYTQFEGQRSELKKIPAPTCSQK